MYSFLKYHLFPGTSILLHNKQTNKEISSFEHTLSGMCIQSIFPLRQTTRRFAAYNVPYPAVAQIDTINWKEEELKKNIYIYIYILNRKPNDSVIKLIVTIVILAHHVEVAKEKWLNYNKLTKIVQKTLVG